MPPLDPYARFTSGHSASSSKKVLSCADFQGLIPLGIGLGGAVSGALGGWFGRGGGAQWIGL